MVDPASRGYDAAVYDADTIAAIATPAGIGAVAIVRVSGPRAIAIAKTIFAGFPSTGLESHRLYVGRVTDTDGAVLDRGLAVVMRSPHSYTGEDVVELQVHGSPVVARAVLELTFRHGARAARSGEFTMRAFLNGKIDLAQAESVADLVAASTPAAARAAALQLDGSLSRAVEEILDVLVGTAAELEASLDFAEEDVGDIDVEEIARRLEAQAVRCRDLASTSRRGRLLRHGARVAIVGKPNVGKSSLLNRLLLSDRAIVTPIAGTTRDALEEAAEIDGIPVVVVDTAGLRPTADEVEREGVRRTREQIGIADLVLLVVDASTGLDAVDRDVLEAVTGTPFLVVANKIDLGRAASSNGHRPAVYTSARTGEGIAELRREITREVGGGQADFGGLAVLRERHRSALEAAAAALDVASRSLEEGGTADVIAVDVNLAIGALSEILGRVPSAEDVLHRIFGEFCIGK
ncbi:MAG: tRNA modification GTPase [Candidatus Binatota bacterium]|nr:tRNA modification GTPase [Candidatus Binatota bacterium]